MAATNCGKVWQSPADSVITPVYLFYSLGTDFMADFQDMRRNMVDCQLRTNGIVSAPVIGAFSSVPREDFVVPGVCVYADGDTPLPRGGFMMEPLVLARMLQAADPRPEDVVLNVGDASGYSSALLAGMVSAVVTLESEAHGLDSARVSWTAMGIRNIATVRGATSDGCPRHAPYSLIVINGAAGQIPASLTAQLSEGGRLITVIRQEGQAVGCISLLKPGTGGHLSSHDFQQASTLYVSGLEPEAAFVF